jgi:hypothetical protein
MRRDLMNEQKALIAILLLGSLRDRKAVHEVPRQVISAGTDVETMSAEAIAGFHRNSDNSLTIRYLPNLIAQTGSLGLPLAKYMIKQISENCSDDEGRRLEAMAAALTWGPSLTDAKF